MDIDFSTKQKCTEIIIGDFESVTAILGYPNKPRFNLFLGSHISVPKPSYAPGVENIKEKVTTEPITAFIIWVGKTDV